VDTPEVEGNPLVATWLLTNKPEAFPKEKLLLEVFPKEKLLLEVFQEEKLLGTMDSSLLFHTASTTSGLH
jgi:hypothetical protein